jgi:hypothetical protein
MADVGLDAGAVLATLELPLLLLVGVFHDHSKQVAVYVVENTLWLGLGGKPLRPRSLVSRRAVGGVSLAQAWVCPLGNSKLHVKGQE